MTYGDQERTERTLFSLHFMATTDECREIYTRIYATAVYREHDILSTLINAGRFSAFDPRARAMVERCSELYFELRDMVLKEVAAMEARQ